MKVDISNQLANEIKDFIENDSTDEAVAFSLIEQIHEAIEAEKKAYDDYIESLTDSIQM